MALTERTVEDKIEIVGEHKIVQVRTATIIERDGVEVTRSFHRQIIAPNEDISEQSAEVQAVCKALWTQELKDAYAAQLPA